MKINHLVALTFLAAALALALGIASRHMVESGLWDRPLGLVLCGLAGIAGTALFVGATDAAGTIWLDGRQRRRAERAAASSTA